MTRKRFWGLRNALNVRLNEWGKTHMGGCPSGIGDKAMRPVSGKPLIDFKKAKEMGLDLGTSYKEAWEKLAGFREGLGM